MWAIWKLRSSSTMFTSTKNRLLSSLNVKNSWTLWKLLKHLNFTAYFKLTDFSRLQPKANAVTAQKIVSFFFILQISLCTCVYNHYIHASYYFLISYSTKSFWKKKKGCWIWRECWHLIILNEYWFNPETHRFKCSVYMCEYFIPCLYGYPPF